MFKVGDRVIIKYPERSTWNDTIQGLQDGYINQTSVYIITRLEPESVQGNSAWIEPLTQDEEMPLGEWGLGILALAPWAEVPKRKRSLPDWF